MFLVLFSILVYPVAFVTFVVCASIYLAFVFVFKSLGWELQYLGPLVRFLARVILLSCGQWLKVGGNWPSPTIGPCIFLFNHSSILDALVAGAVLKGRFTGVAAQEYFFWPLWGTIMRWHNIIPIKRKCHDEAIESMRRAEEAIKNGWSIGGFPEGTRSKTGELQPFKKGLFYVAKATGAPIVVIAIKGAYRAKSRVGWCVRPGVITATIGKPWTLWSNGKQRYAALSVEELRQLAEGLMATMLES
ncbi:MAG: lysophospholipid acyltransferase family protein [Patescibacteria group bacterium]